jgi:sugar phosphate isomerase/epimerase
MLDERWDTLQEAYLDHCVEKHGILILALQIPLRVGVWRLDPEVALVLRSPRLAVRLRATLVVVHPPPLGRPLALWPAGTLETDRGEGVRVAVENKKISLPKYAFSIRRNRTPLPETPTCTASLTSGSPPAMSRRAVYITQVYDRLACQLLHVHLSDSDFTGGDQHRIPGRGKLPPTELLASLNRDGYLGVVRLELKPWPLGTPEPG